MKLEVDREITAPSAFINAGIRVGPLPLHRLITSVATLAALALVLLGGLYGWSNNPNAALAFVQAPTKVDTVNSDSSFGSQVVQIVVSSCGVTSTRHGLIVGPDIIIAATVQAGMTDQTDQSNEDDPPNRTDQADHASTVSVSETGDDSGQRSTPGTVIGVDESLRLMVIRANLGTSSQSFVWRSATGLSQGEAVFVVVPNTTAMIDLDTGTAGFEAIEATIESMRYDRDGVPTIVQLSSTETTSFLPGSAVLDQTSRLIGVIDLTGKAFDSSDSIQPGVSAVMVTPQTPSSCAEVAE